MRDLNHDPKRLQAAHDDRSHGTRTARSYALAQMADTLHDLGFKGLRATGLRRKHVVALVTEWKRQGRSIGTMKNRMAHVRWWAARIGKAAMVPSNAALGIANHEYVTNEDRRVVLHPDKLALVKDVHVAMALRLEAEFGLRREEAIKFTPARDDRGDRIRPKGSTTKGGRPREVPVRNEAQRRLLDEARRVAGGGALIPPERNYRQQLKVYESRTREAGLYRMHGLRHAYAISRYEELAGWKPPVAGGPAQASLAGARRRMDAADDHGGTRAFENRDGRSLHRDMTRAAVRHGASRPPGRARSCPSIARGHSAGCRKPPSWPGSGTGFRPGARPTVA